MSERPVWLRNEYQQINTDFSDEQVVKSYEQFMGEFRNLAAEDAGILSALALPAGSHILDIGTGTGHFALAAARAGHRVTAVDISQAMLDYAAQTAKDEGLTDLEFHQAGFLTLYLPSATFDAAVSTAVLHHLSDSWKAMALGNVRRVLKPGGKFVLRDVVFNTKDRDLQSEFDLFVEKMPPAMRDRVAGHIANEFSTLDWIMEGLLTKAGFNIENIDESQAPMLQYLCQLK